MANVTTPDLLIVARRRAAFFDVVERLGHDAPNVEIRLDRRRLERRRASEATTTDERRRADRRALDVSEALRTVGWILIPAAERAVPSPLSSRN